MMVMVDLTPPYHTPTNTNTNTNTKTHREEAMPGLGGLPPSFLSIDTDGRVLHLESLSKWICPGTCTTTALGCSHGG